MKRVLILATVTASLLAAVALGAADIIWNGPAGGSRSAQADIIWNGGTLR